MLATLHLLLYRKVLRLWWTFDDPNLLHATVPVGFGAPFTSTALWPQQLFTPLLMTAFQLEELLFSAADPRKWYAMQLVIGFLAALAVYASARAFLTFEPSLAAAALFVAGAPLCSVMTQLSTVHYLIAITFGALALWAFVAAVRGDSSLLAGCSALLYLGAMLAKEVAVPLPLLLLALPVGELRSRARKTAGHWLALVLYFAWRRAVIGTFLGSYGWVIAPTEWPRLLLLLPWRVAGGAAGKKPWLGVLLIASMAFVIILGLVRDRRGLLLLSVSALVVVGPLLPVAKEVNRRYVLVPWLACAVAFAAYAHKLPRKSQRAAALLLVLLLAISVNRQEWGHEFGMRQRMPDESRTFFELPPNGLLRHPAPPPATMRELSWVKLVYLGKQAGGAWFYDDIHLCTHDMSAKRVWEFDPKRLTVAEITGRIPVLSRSFCDALRNSAPLTADFHVRGSALQWEFGPYAEGRYTAVVGDGFETFHVPRKDALFIPGVTALALRVRYDSPDGWTTYSPELLLDFTRQSDFGWRR